MSELEQRGLLVAGEEVTEEETISPKSRINKRLLFYQIGIIIFTFFNYSFIHMVRQSWSVSKDKIEADLDISSNTLGVFDALFLGFYSAGLVINGYLGDRYNLKLVIGLGLICTGCCSACLAIGGLTEIKNPVYYGVFFCINGIVQSTGWPCNVSVVGNWSPRKIEGLIMGIWCVCNNVGNIFGQELYAILVTHADVRWPYVILIAACVCGGWGFLVLFFLIDHPSRKGFGIDTIEPPSISRSIRLRNTINQNKSIATHNTQVRSTIIQMSEGALVSPQYTQMKGISILDALKIKGVLILSITYAFMKLGNYSIFFKFTNYAAHWLKQDDESLKTNLANLYDAGSILGSILIGFSSDLFKKRSPILGSCLVFATIVSFCGFGIDKDNYKHLYYMLPILGFFLAGSCNIISSVSCTELGKDEALKSNSKAMSVVTGIVDGTGSAGAAIGQIVISQLTNIYWPYLWFGIGVSVFLAIVSLWKIIIDDMIDLKREKKEDKMLTLIATNITKLKAEKEIPENLSII